MGTATANRPVIRQGRVGESAPSIAFLSQEHGHARPTCSRALRMLEDEGLLTRIPGLGYYVNHG